METLHEEEEAEHQNEGDIELIPEDGKCEE